MTRQAIVMLFVFWAGVSTIEAQDAAAQRTAVFSRDIAPFVKRFCVDCHGAKNPEGKFSFVGVGLTGDLAKPRELQVWQAVYEKLEGREMPPRDAEQPTEAERAQVAKWLATSIRAAGVVLDDGKWLAPVKGNYVDHQTLFSGKSVVEANGTNPRLWRLTGQAYEDYFDKLNKHFLLDRRNYGEFKLTAPWNFTPQPNFVDYASAHRVGEAEIEFLLRNASSFALSMVNRHSKMPSYGGYIKELVTLIKAGDAATPEQAEAALAPTFQGLF